jgi:hypothetical protein
VTARAPVGRGWVTPETTIPDLVRQLGTDSKVLVISEVQLAKLEMREATHRAGAASLWLAVAFAAALVAAVAVTLFVATLVGRIVAGHMWLGCIVAAGVDIAGGAFLLKHGMREFAEPSEALDELRSAQR